MSRHVMLRGSLKGRLISAVPRGWQTPLRYHYRRLRRRLERELPFLETILKEPHTCLDVGANYGLYTYVLSKLGRRTIAFEPVAACADALEAYFGRSIEIHRVALSSRTGRASIYVPHENGLANAERTRIDRNGPGTRKVEVDVKRLDDFDLVNVSFIKIDVEGHELSVLDGAAGTLERNRPVLLVEVEQRHNVSPISETFERIQSFGYAGHFLAANTLRPVSEFSYERDQMPFVNDVYNPGHVNNFFFIPK
jgi:FkbM family methyltransferase